MDFLLISKYLASPLFYYSYFIFIACTCDEDGSVDNNCDINGKCTCKANVVGDNCDQCAGGFFGFPTCGGTYLSICK